MIRSCSSHSMQCSATQGSEPVDQSWASDISLNPYTLGLQDNASNPSNPGKKTHSITETAVTMAMSNVTIRRAKQDANAASNIKASENDLLDLIDFDNQSSARGSSGRFAHILLAVAPEDSAVAGMATYFGRSSVCLEDLFVLPAYRRRGYARDLIAAIAREASGLGCERIEWQCYRDNQRALQFYQSLGAKVMEPITYLPWTRQGGFIEAEQRRCRGDAEAKPDTRATCETQPVLRCRIRRRTGVLQYDADEPDDHSSSVAQLRDKQVQQFHHEIQLT
ncbi:hypothetical protein F66182_11701 [Fusarium sp. NRRL 66182]|nr:hypothetical protein F66182_11701 [Fusarium sp. NRRL 66182]